MCGRYVVASPPLLLAQHFGVDEVVVDDIAASWNVAPTDRVPAVAEHRGRRLLGAFRWGLVPPWAKDASGAARMINARAESVTEKPAFRDAFRFRRCLIPADGFYEWKLTTGGLKQPVFIHPADGAPLAFAGLWATWGDMRTCTIVTTTANARLQAFHDRMPVVLPAEAWPTWLDRDESDVALLHSLLVPAPDDALDVRTVGTAVNDVRNKGPELVAPVKPV